MSIEVTQITTAEIIPVWLTDEQTTYGGWLDEATCSNDWFGR